MVNCLAARLNAPWCTSVRRTKLFTNLWYSAATTSGGQAEGGTQELRKRKSTHLLSSFPEFLSSFFRIGYSSCALAPSARLRHCQPAGCRYSSTSLGALAM